MDKLQALREQNVLSREELAKKAGVHRNTIARLEKNKKGFPSTIRKLAHALGVEPRELVKG